MLIKHHDTMKNNLTSRVFVASARDKGSSPASKDGEWLNHLGVSAEGRFAILDHKKFLTDSHPKDLLRSGTIKLPLVTPNVPGRIIREHFELEMKVV